jgi:hypothetical protein
MTATAASEPLLLAPYVVGVATAVLGCIYSYIANVAVRRYVPPDGSLDRSPNGVVGTVVWAQDFIAAGTGLVAPMTAGVFTLYNDENRRGLAIFLVLLLLFASLTLVGILFAVGLKSPTGYGLRFTTWPTSPVTTIMLGANLIALLLAWKIT